MFKFKRVLFCSIISLLIYSDIARATVVTYSPVIAQGKNSGAQTLLLQTSPQDLSNQYVANNARNTSLGGQLFLGKEFCKKEYIKLNLGLTLGFIDSINIDGIVNQFALPDFDNLNYQYSVRSLSAMATLKMFFLPNQKWQPYIVGSVGLANNNASDYHETPRVQGAEVMSPYSNHSTNSFAYNLGVGLMYNVNQVLSLGLGYQYADLGKANLGASMDQQTTQTPNNHIYLHELLLSLSWNI